MLWLVPILRPTQVVSPPARVGGRGTKEKAGREARLVSKVKGASYGTVLDQAEVSPDSKPSTKSENGMLFMAARASLKKAVSSG